MNIRIIIAFALMLAALVGDAGAQVTTPLGPGNGPITITPLGPGMSTLNTAPTGPGGSGSGGGVIPPPFSGCNPGQLDFSVATGCNLVWAGH